MIAPIIPYLLWITMLFLTTNRSISKYHQSYLCLPNCASSNHQCNTISSSISTFGKDSSKFNLGRAEGAWRRLGGAREGDRTTRCSEFKFHICRVHTIGTLWNALLIVCFFNGCFLVGWSSCLFIGVLFLV